MHKNGVNILKILWFKFGDITYGLNKYSFTSHF